MLREEAIELLFDIQTDAVYNVLSDEKEALEMAINVLKQQPCEDCISRKATIEAIYKKYIEDNGAIKNAPSNDLYAEGLAKAVDVIWDMPSVTPTIPTARWERLVDDFKKCSKCGKVVKTYRNYKYCPECGARMETETKNRAGLNFADQDTMMSAT